MSESILCYDWRSFDRPIYVGVKPHLGPKTRFLLLSDTSLNKRRSDRSWCVNVTETSADRALPPDAAARRLSVPGDDNASSLPLAGFLLNYGPTKREFQLSPAGYYNQAASDSIIFCTSSYLVHRFTRTHTSVCWAMLFLLHLSSYKMSVFLFAQAVFWDVKPCSLVRVQRQALLAPWFLLFARLAYSATPTMESVYNSPKRRWNYTGIHGVTFHKIVPVK
jgi:hypothetical protein